MKSIFFLIYILFYYTSAIAETETIKNTYGGDSRAEACQDAKNSAQRWADRQEPVPGRQLREHSFSSCDCSSKKNYSGKDEWVCTVDATVKELSSSFRSSSDVVESVPFDDTYADKSTACRGVREKVQRYVNQTAGAVLKGISSCDCSSKPNGIGSGEWWTCFVNATVAKPR